MTIRDIAKKTGYAVSTVSRALNDHPDVSEETKQKIKEVVEQCHFVPNSNARQLKVQQRKGICIIVAGASNMFLAGILEQVQTQIASEGYPTEVQYVDECTNVVRVAQQMEREQKPLAILFLGGNIADFKKEFRKIKTPCVLAASAAKDLSFENLSMVGIDDKQAAANAAEYLIENGHTKIAVIGGNRDNSYVSQARWQGFSETYQKKLQRACAQSDYYTSSFRLESGYHTMKKILQTEEKPTAVFCLSDIIAVGAMRAAYEEGLQIPKDISFLGFDGIALVSYCTPSLSSVQQPQREMANISVKLLLEQIQKGAKCQVVTVPTLLLEGESVLIRKTAEDHSTVS